MWSSFRLILTENITLGGVPNIFKPQDGIKIAEKCWQKNNWIFPRDLFATCVSNCAGFCGSRRSSRILRFSGLLGLRGGRSPLRGLGDPGAAIPRPADGHLTDHSRPIKAQIPETQRWGSGLMPCCYFPGECGEWDRAPACRVSDGGTSWLWISVTYIRRFTLLVDWWSSEHKSESLVKIAEFWAWWQMKKISQTSSERLGFQRNILFVQNFVYACLTSRRRQLAVSVAEIFLDMSWWFELWFWVNHVCSFTFWSSNGWSSPGFCPLEEWISFHMYNQDLQPNNF